MSNNLSSLIQLMNTMQIISDRTRGHLQEAVEHYQNRNNTALVQLGLQTLLSYYEESGEENKEEIKEENKENFYDEILYEMIGDEKTCSICIEDYAENDEIVLTVCDHIYHKKCINEWIKTRPNCPICRNSFRPE